MKPLVLLCKRPFNQDIMVLGMVLFVESAIKMEVMTLIYPAFDPEEH
jgi:hypothetical protein